MTRSNAPLVVNNTGTDLREFDSAIAEAARNGGRLPEELADLLTMTAVEVDGATRWILNWA